MKINFCHGLDAGRPRLARLCRPTRRRPAHRTRTSSWPGTCSMWSPSDVGPPHERTTADHAGDRPQNREAPARPPRPDPGTGRSRPGAHRGHRRLRDERARPRPVRPRVRVSGCEARESITVAGLRALGADVVVGHSPRHLDDSDTFVFTTAINPGTRSSSPRGRAASWSCAGPPRRLPPVRRGSPHHGRRHHGSPPRHRRRRSRCRHVAWTVLRQPSPRRTTRPIGKRWHSRRMTHRSIGLD
jgi:hypothetical protein